MHKNIAIEPNFFLRPLEIADAKRLALLANNPKIASKMTNLFPHPYKYSDAYNFITKVAQQKVDQIWGIDWQGELVGVCGIHPQEDVYAPNAELGYWIGEEYWGNGITAKAVEALINFSWEKWKILERIFAGIYSNNPQSARVLQKLGFEQEACFKRSILKLGELLDTHIYAVYRSI
jgi:ribosomal-protein-alanine N-acetyltransferase